MSTALQDPDRLARRVAAVPARIRYPEQLPVSERRDEIAAAIRDHQVVVLAGETGSGKTTQLPKICLELGRGVAGMIGHTQPRRLAARSVAERIAEELDVPLGTAVGYTVRFHDQVGEDTLVKLMTDGVLLAEIARDRDLRRYDTIIVDEAHERSLNIDFLLGYLKQLLPRRPDLKLVITSATIDPQRFSDHFGGAPVLEVSGRSFPVEVRYRPYADTDLDQVQAVLAAVDELAAEGPGDVLVFLSGEREIRDTADALRGVVDERTEVVPLYARLSAAEQHRVFAPHQGRRIVLATNVAETSLTVPGIRYVVDTGTARISRYSQRTKVQRLPIEPVSQASATQRAGRCGRVAPGIAIRLYDEDDLLARPAFTEPEVLRTNLASVILQMTSLGLGEVLDFPFVEPPDRRSVKDGVELLLELGALRPEDPRRLTRVGRTLAQLPLDPRLARMVVEADRLGCVRDVLVVVAGLTVQDVRERPSEGGQRAAELHRRFEDETSDFLSYLNLWHYLQEQQKALSGNAFRRMCRDEHLHYLRVREWQDLHAQLRRLLKPLKLSLDASPTNADAVHQALLAGLLSQVGLRDPDKRDYLGARGARWAVVPSSAVSKKQPRWAMAAELVETTRTWGRVVARVDPGWVERSAAHLVKRTYSEPTWNRKQAQVTAVERVTLYGIPLVAGRTVAFGRIAPVLSREVFLQSALVEGDWDTRHAFFAANRALLEDAEELEHRARRRDLVVDDRALYDFYDARVPADVVSGAHFDSWWKRASRETPDLLTLRLTDLVSGEGAAAALDAPDVWVQGDLSLPLSYAYEPGSPADGVTAHVPVEVLNRLSPEGFEWQVPGLRQELVTALLKSLPKPLRVRIGPAPDAAAHLLAVLEPRARPLLDALESEIVNTRRIDVRREDWDWSRVPAHLRMTFRVEDDRGKVLAEGKDLVALQQQLRPRVEKALTGAAPSVERTGLTGWTIGVVPREVQQGAVRGYPALVDEGATVGVKVHGTPADAAAAHWRGTRRLLLLTVPSPAKAISGRLTNVQKLALTKVPGATPAQVFEDCTTCALDALVTAAGGPAWDEAGFAALRDAVRAELVPEVERVLDLVVQALVAAGDLRARLAAERRPALAPAVREMSSHVDALVHPGFATEHGRDRLPDVLRYLQAVGVRLDRLPENPARDARAAADVARAEADLADLRKRVPPSPEVEAVRWMVEELRVSLFAQGVRTKHPVSLQRIWKAMDALLP